MSRQYFLQDEKTNVYCNIMLRTSIILLFPTVKLFIFLMSLKSNYKEMKEFRSYHVLNLEKLDSDIGIGSAKCIGEIISCSTQKLQRASDCEYHDSVRIFRLVCETLWCVLQIISVYFLSETAQC